MHGGVVERIDPTANPEESGGLLERLRPELRHLPEVVSTPEHSVRIAMGHDVPGHRRGESRHVAEQLFRGRVHVDADVIHATLYRLLQLPLQQPLIDVVLVLAHADRLRIDLHQLRERILKPASDAHRSADGDVEVRELVDGHGTGRVDRGPRLVDHHLDRPLLEAGQHLGHERIGLASGGPVPDGDQLDPVPLDHAGQRSCGAVSLAGRCMRDDRLILEELPGVIQSRQLAAGTESRIDAERRLHPGRAREEQLSQVSLERRDRRRIGLLLFLEARLADERELDQALERVPQHPTKESAELFVSRADLSIGKKSDHVRFVEDQIEEEHALVLAAPQGEHVVRRDVLHPHPEVAIHLVLGRSGGELVLYARHERALVHQIVADVRPEIRLLRYLLSEDVRCPGQRLGDRRNAVLRRDVLRRFSLDRGRRSIEHVQSLDEPGQPV